MTFQCRLLTPLVHATAILSLVLLVPTPALGIEPAATDPAWVEYVGALMTAEESELFDSLQQHYARREFVERFWLSRDPDKSTPRNELRETWPQRIGSAEDDFGGIASDRGRTFLLNGPPKYMLNDLCQPLMLPVEIWFYPPPASEEDSLDTAVVFFAEEEGGEPILWDPGSHSTIDLLRSTTMSAREATRQLHRDCRRGKEISAILEQALTPSSVFAAPAGGNWLGSFRQDILGVARRHLDCELAFGFPEQSQGQTAVDGLLTVNTTDEGQSDPVTIILDGDIFRGDRRADHFRYRFDAPLSGSDRDRLTFSFRRYLAPGAYRLLLTARDPGAQSIFHTETVLQVPSVNGFAANTSAVPADSTIQETSVKIQPLPLGLITGRQRVDVVPSGDEIAGVVFYLDGRAVMKKSRPPFSVELDLGDRPRTHTLEVVGHDLEGRELGRDLVPINVGPHRFAVRLIEPHQGFSYPNELRVHADVNIPPGENLDRVELFFNEARVATLYQAPFVQPNLKLPVRNATGYVRAVAYLDDGNSADDLVVVNTASTVDQVQVDFVELYASALDRRGAPVSGLTRDDFRVFEDGIEQPIRRFEMVRDLPINAGIVLDTSISMIEEIEEAEEAALQFFENVIRPKDRAAVVVFSDQPELKVPLTNNHSRLAAGLAGIEASGETTLYDSVVFGLYYLVGLRGKRALILLTDGLDSQSKYTFEDTLEFAKFSGVAVYSIGIGLSSRELEAQRVLRLLASETGGDSYFIDSASELKRIYAKIESELRSQYLIGYQSSQSGSDEFRRIEIRTSRPHLEIKAIPGYYP